jgi:hypothetical protein
MALRGGLRLLRIVIPERRSEKVTKSDRQTIENTQFTVKNERLIPPT